MLRTARALFVCMSVLLVDSRAQDAAPAPAPELKRLEPLVGNWSGSGKMTEPGNVTSEWTARGTYRWALDGHFLREDFAINFKGVEGTSVSSATSAGTARTNASSA
jgi:hypothetical protein